MLASFDSETRGLWGEIFRIGYYDEKNGYTNFYNAEEFMLHIYEIARKLPIITIEKKQRGKMIEKEEQDILYIYAFNLEFDFSKIIQEFHKKKINLKIDYDKSLIIDGKFHVVKILGINIKFLDILPIVKSSLDDASNSFQLNYKKQKIENMDNYSKTVNADDEGLLTYMKNDVLATYELVEKVRFLSGLTETEFVKCPTIASLSMKVFKNNFPEDYEIIKESGLKKEHEEFVRAAYHGGRTEVYKNIGKNLYHYDVNSLYPYVMQSQYFPIGDASMTKKGTVRKDGTIFTLEEKKDFLDKKEYLYIIECEVEVPEQNYPPLPFQNGGKLLFPVGTFNGSWTSEEMKYAVNHCNVKILQIFKIIWWWKKKKVFEGFITKFRSMKENSEGAKRVFAKYIQNSLYGKFGMKRKRVVYTDFTQEKRDKLNEKGEKNAKFSTVYLQQELLMYNKFFFADYIRPQFAAFVTSYSRIELLKTIHYMEAIGSEIYYCDTDSLVTSIPITSNFCHKNEYGKWKLEREVAEGIYILPKLYAEKEEGGEEILKSKGIIYGYMKQISIAKYHDFYKNMVNAEDVILYNGEFFGRHKILQCLIHGKDIEEKVPLKKSFIFSADIHKRIFDFTNNSSKPIKMEGGIRWVDEDEKKKAVEAWYEKQAEKERRKLRKVIISMGGIKDIDYPHIPSSWKRKKTGRGLDELATELASFGYFFHNADELYEAIS